MATYKDSSTFGQRVAAFRQVKALSQRQLASLLGHSESWVSQVERDVVSVERMPVLQDIADALGVTIHELRPELASDKGSSSGKDEDNMAALRLALTGHPAPREIISLDNQPEPSDPGEMHQRLEDAWAMIHASRLTEVSEALASLLPDLEATLRRSLGTQRQEILTQLARAYQAASAVFARVEEIDAAWLAADRAVHVAEHSENRLDVFAGLFRMAQVFITLRRSQRAERVAAQATDALAILTDNPDPPLAALSLKGAMHLVQAVIFAQAANRTATRAQIEHAHHTANRLGEDRNDYNTEFGPTNVQLHEISTALDLGDAGFAMELAQRVDPGHLSQERQTRLRIDLARANTQRRDTDEALTQLLHAEQLTPQQFHTHPIVYQTISDLLGLAGRRPTGELLNLARRARVTP